MKIGQLKQIRKERQTPGYYYMIKTDFTRQKIKTTTKEQLKTQAPKRTMRTSKRPAETMRITTQPITKMRRKKKDSDNTK